MIRSLRWTLKIGVTSYRQLGMFVKESKVPKLPETERQQHIPRVTSIEEGHSSYSGRCWKVTFLGNWMTSQARWHRPVIIAPGRWAQEEESLNLALAIY